MDSFLLFLLVGFLAQAIDGALGMAYGVVSSTVLISLGVPPAAASATVHAAEVFTTAASAGSHIVHRNVNWRFLLPLAGAGMVGGALGAYVLTGVDGQAIRPFVVAYLGFMGAAILLRASKRPKIRVVPNKWAAPIGVVGGFADAAGGGGWGSTVTSTLVGAGKEPRMAVGTANAAEFFVTVAVSAAFLVALLTGRWDEAGLTAQAVQEGADQRAVAHPMAVVELQRRHLGDRIGRQQTGVVGVRVGRDLFDMRRQSLLANNDPALAGERRSGRDEQLHRRSWHRRRWALDPSRAPVQQHSARSSGRAAPLVKLD